MAQTGKILHWTPRILCITAILFVSLFALDAFDPELSLRHQIRDFALHLIPSFTLLLFLILAWRKELLGGIILTIIGLVLTPFIFRHNYHMNQSVLLSLVVILTITVPFVLTGLLFIGSYYYKKKNRD